jgi:hypothetical protein
VPSRCLHVSITAGRVSERHPIAVIPDRWLVLASGSG